mmetsp:Transcript_42476/g.65134  ORF Transcript_42476/g.65134 Transcript_42476/m.65134 type:complete len:109 (-) Transcript_42476:2220-2546(-)
MLELDEKAHKFLKNIEVEMQQITDQMEYEKSEISKQRKKIKLELTNEINLVKDGQQFMNYEFKRINTFLEKSLRILRYLVEDSILNQMLTEQDSLDRKQLNLFGLKKN